MTFSHSVGVWAAGTHLSAVMTGVVANTITAIHDGLVPTGALVDDCVTVDSDDSSDDACLGPVSAIGYFAGLVDFTVCFCKGDGMLKVCVA